MLEYVEFQVEERVRLRRERLFLKNQLVFGALATLPVAATDDVVRAACASFDRDETIPSEFRLARLTPRAALRANDETFSRQSAGLPLMVHLSLAGAGDEFFRTALRELQTRTCGRTEGQVTGVEAGNTDKTYVVNPERNHGTEPSDESESVDFGDSGETEKFFDSDEKPAAVTAPGPSEKYQVDPSDDDAKLSAQGQQNSGERKHPRCSPWRETLDFFHPTNGPSDSLGSLTYRAASPLDLSFGRMQKAMGNMPYRAVFVTRDPRDVVVQAYLERIEPRARAQSQSRATKTTKHSGSAADRGLGVEFEIDAFTAAASLSHVQSSTLGLMSEQFRDSFHRLSSSVDDGYQIADGTESDDASASDEYETSRIIANFAQALRALSKKENPNVKFVRFEDLLKANSLGFELLARWFGYSDAYDITVFVKACEEAQKRCLENDDELPPGSWRKHFSLADQEKFNQKHGALLKSLGYL